MSGGNDTLVKPGLVGVDCRIGDSPHSSKLRSLPADR